MTKKPRGPKRVKDPWTPEAGRIGKRVKQLRESKKLSGPELAEKIGKTQQYISNLEGGLFNPENSQAKWTINAVGKYFGDNLGLDWIVLPNSIPITARVGAGLAVEFFNEGDDKDSIEVDPRMMFKKGKYFALRVDGESMTDAHIIIGDVVLVRTLPKGEIPNPGDVVVADIRAEGITLKFWKSTDEEVTLIPGSKGYDPTKHERWRVKPVAVVVGVIRMVR